MFISRKKFNSIEKRVAKLENQLQARQDKTINIQLDKSPDEIIKAPSEATVGKKFMEGYLETKLPPYF